MIFKMQFRVTVQIKIKFGPLLHNIMYRFTGVYGTINYEIKRDSGNIGKLGKKR